MKHLFVFFLAIAALSLISFVGAPKGDAQNALPHGTYQQTCKNIKVDENGLYATCQKRDGTWKKTSLGSANFPCREIDNEDGDLVCLSNVDGN